MEDGLIETHIFNLSPGNNGGESLSLVTKLYTNGDKEEHLYMNQELTLQSYGNSASIQLFGNPITPDLLRQLANELDSLIARNK